jgi:hypothetical protein
MKTALALLLMLSSAAHADSKAWSTGKAVIGPNATMVGGVNATSVRTSALYDKFLPLLMAKASDLKTTLDSIQKECKLDVLASIDSVAFGFDGNKSGTIVVALKGTNHSAIDTCVQKLGKADNKPVTITAEGKLTKYDGVSDKPIYIDWLASDVFAMSTQPDDKDITKQVLVSGVTSSKDLKAGLAATDKSASIWAVYNETRDLPDNVGKMKQIYGSAKISNKKIDFTSHLVTDSQKSSQAFSDEANKQITALEASGPQAVQTALKNVTVKVDGSMVAATGWINSDDVFPLLMSVMM